MEYDAIPPKCLDWVDPIDKIPIFFPHQFSKYMISLQIFLPHLRVQTTFRKILARHLYISNPLTLVRAIAALLLCLYRRASDIYLG